MIRGWCRDPIVESGSPTKFLMKQHPWDVTEDEAARIQLQVASSVIIDDARPVARLIGGVSIRPLGESVVRAAVCILELPVLRETASAAVTAEAHCPYIAGLRAFHAGPAVIRAFGQLRIQPDLVLWDGHGIAHPRRCGLASHLGVLLNVPSVGVSEELLYGQCDLEALQKGRGSAVPVLDPQDGAVIGAAVRTRSSTRPFYVSVGHRVSLESAVRIVLECAPRYRIPEPLRHARMLARRALGV